VVELRDFAQDDDTKRPILKGYIQRSEIVIRVWDAIEAAVHNIGVQCLLRCLAHSGIYEAYEDSRFLESGLFRACLGVMGSSDGFCFYAFGPCAKTAYNVRRTLFPQ
jgi:hypothetical protein